MPEIADIIKKITASKEEIYSVVGTVTEINESERVILVKPNNNAADIFDVRLQTVVSGALGLVSFPVLGSEVIVTFLSKEVAYVSLFSAIEKIQLNIGDFSLFVDASNMNLAVENIDIISTNTELSSDNVKINASDTQINSDTVKVVSSVSFEVQGANIKLSAPIVEIIAGAITMSGAIALNGAITMNGGGLGGIPTGGQLATKLNVVENDLNDLKAKFNAWTPVANDGGTALKNQLNNWHTTNIVPTTQNDISNPQITQ